MDRADLPCLNCCAIDARTASRNRACRSSPRIRAADGKLGRPIWNRLVDAALPGGALASTPTPRLMLGITTHAASNGAVLSPWSRGNPRHLSRTLAPRSETQSAGTSNEIREGLAAKSVEVSTISNRLGQTTGRSDGEIQTVDRCGVWQAVFWAFRNTGHSCHRRPTTGSVQARDESVGQQKWS